MDKINPQTPDANNARFPLEIVGHKFKMTKLKRGVVYTVTGYAMSVPPADTGEVGFWVGKLSRPGYVMNWLVPITELTDPAIWERVL